MSKLVEIKGINLGYQDKAILKDISITLSRGDFLGIVGPNGSGKTTLLRAILGWIKPTEGTIELKSGLRFGYVPQRNQVDHLFPVSALEVVMMGLYSGKSAIERTKDSDFEKARVELKNVGLLHFERELFRNLSGGQQQRVLLARALVGKPDILILDEPTNGMDLVSEAAVLNMVSKVHEELHITVLFVTHLLHLVARYAKTVGIIQDQKLLFGETAEVLTTKNLTALYGIPVQVESVKGQTVVLMP